MTRPDHALPTNAADGAFPAVGAEPGGQPIECRQSSRDPNTCPLTVKAGGALWLAGCTLNAVRLVDEFNWADGVMYLTFAVLIALWLSVAWFVWRGEKWARWLLLGLVAFGMLSFARLVERVAEISPFDVVLAVALAICHVSAAGLLLTGSANRWFRKESRHAG
jgi:hypothetical protein